MNKKIIQALSSLGIPVAFLEYKGNEDAYAVFQVYNEEDADFSDDGNEAEISYITINYWYRKPADMAKAKQIKALMKQNGFLFDGAQDLVGEQFYGKSLDFIIKEYN
jgi:hypothetical protein